MEAKGANGAVAFDGNTIIITREGARARMTVGVGEKRIPLRSITAVQWKPAGLGVWGFIQFTLAGGVEVKSHAGRQATSAGKDENSVTFGRKQQAAFEQVRDAVNEALSA